jgi:hypothetical protein
MKKIIYLILVACGVIMFSACSKDSQDLSKVTYYVDMELVGDAVLGSEVGTSFVDPGVTAYENGEDISSTVIVTGSVDSEKVGYYPLSYTAINVDGFPKSVSRKVFVYDPSITTDISGSYTTSDGTKRVYGGTTTTAFTGYGVTIEEVKPGIFYISDFFGGYYDQRAGYGSTYAMTGYFRLHADNTITLLQSSVVGWGDGLDYLEEGSYDPDTKTIKWNISYAGSMIFYIILN